MGAILPDTYRQAIYMGYALIVSAAKTPSKIAPRPDARISIGEALIGLAASLVRWARRDMSLTSLGTLATLDRSGPQLAILATILWAFLAWKFRAYFAPLATRNAA